MRAILMVVGLAAAVAAAPAVSQTSLGGGAVDLVVEVRDLAFATADLAYQVEDLGGAVQSLAVEESDTEIRIELAADVLFDFDKADLRAEAEAALAQVADIIRSRPKAAVRIEGHTDSKGSDKYNRKLSERRAQSVKTWLAKAEGLAGTKFRIKGFGESKPVAANEKPDGSDDPEGRQRNRRVEIVVQK